MTTNNPATEVYRSTTDELPSERIATQRARYLERTTDLSKQEALALGYREQGFASTSIAWSMDVRKQTIERYMDRIIAQYGLEAIETKPPDDRDDLEPVTDQRLGQISDAVLKQWLEAAADHPDRMPDEVDLDSFLPSEESRGRGTDADRSNIDRGGCQ